MAARPGELEPAEGRILVASPVIGDDTFFLFGMNEPEVADLQARGYRPTEYYESNPRLRRALNLIDSGHFTDGNREAASMVVGDLLYNDRFLVLADYQSYLDAQARVETAYADQEAWARSAILNVARSGFFSSACTVSVVNWTG